MLWALCIVLWAHRAISFNQGQSEMLLFDLDKDPFESFDRYNDPEYAEARQALEARFNYFQGTARASFKAEKPVSRTWQAAGGVVPFFNATSVPPKKTSIEGTRKNVIPMEGAPNIMFILLDDVGLNDVSYTEDPSTYMDFATPTLSALAATGIRLTRHYTAWVCGPSRASLMTGRYPIKLGFSQDPGSESNLPLDETTMANELKRAGYRTALIGKWHLGFQARYFL